jgi:hypothetical protein
MEEKDYFNQLIHGMNDPYMQYKKQCNMEKTYVQCNLKPKKLSEKAEYIEEEVEELRKNYDKEVKKKIRES